MRFLLVASFPESLVKFRGSLIQAIQRTGLQVHVAAPDLGFESTIRAQLEDMGVRVHEISLNRTSMNPWSDIKTLLGLWRLLSKIKPTYVLSYTIKPVIYTSVVARFLGISSCNVLITGLGYVFQKEVGFKRSILSVVVKKMYSLCLKKVDIIFFQNPDDEFTFQEAKIIGGGTTSIVVNGSGVDIDEYPMTPLPEQPSFLLIARLIGSKGVREYAEAARQVRSNYPNIKFDLVGWIDENPDSIKEEELLSWISEGVIDYRGRLDDVRVAIKDCSVYVLPSYSEGTPRTVLEAMAMGRAVLTTEAPGCRETVNDGVNGLLVPVKNVSSLAAAMEYLIENPSRVIEMGTNSRKIAVNKFDVHKVNQQMLNAMKIM